MIKRINIFGSSDKIKVLGAERINRLLSLNIPSIGINHFVNHYPDVDYFIFLDSKTLDGVNYQGQKILTNNHIYKNCLKNNEKYNVAGTFEPNGIYKCVMNSGWFACWWAIQQGYTHIYLYGVMDGDNYKHCSNGKSIYNNVFTKNKEQHCFNNKEFFKFEKDIETGYNKGIKIFRPLKGD